MFRKVRTNPVNMEYMPTPKREQVVTFSALTGGINSYELDYRLATTESPEMENLSWREGALNCRDGQVWLNETERGVGYAMTDRTWHGKLFFHAGSCIYSVDPETGEEALQRQDVPQNRGTFFPYNDCLYYKNRGGYYCISYDYTDGSITAEKVEGYTPVILINANPATCAGDIYQPENRISAKKTVWYTVTAEGVTEFHLPVVATSVNTVAIGGTATTAYSYSNGVVTLNSAAPVDTNGNSVKITYSLANEDAYNSVMSCPYAAVYGGATGALCIVLGGCEAQPNAYFWNGNNIAMDASYFPFTQYQLAGDSNEAITGFGKQQSYLVVFKEHSIGRTSLSTETVDERTTIDFAYTPINAAIGCDVPWSIQLVENYLVWCNKEEGAFLLNNLSAAFENNVTGLSKKINGYGGKGLLYDLRNGATVASVDDSTRYWIVANGHAWVWDYELSTFKNPSWFYYTNINAVAFAYEYGATRHLDGKGRVTEFKRCFADYGEAIRKKFRFATQNFGTYDALKNVNSVIIAMRSDTNAEVELTYKTDYETRKDLTNLTSKHWSLLPRNLNFRSLTGRGFAEVLRRKPMCRRVKHFTMMVENNNVAEDLSIVSAQIFYYYEGKHR